MRAGAARLLILGCSARKRGTPGLLPAVERYDGPTFRVLRRYLRSNPERLPRVAILSAQYGLITADRLIPPYDRRLTSGCVPALIPRVRAQAENLLRDGCYAELFVCAGALYRQVLIGALDALPVRPAITETVGSPGKQLSTLHDWLHGAPPGPIRPSPSSSGPLRFRGIMVSLTAEAAREAARRALVEGGERPDRYQSWYVVIDGRRVAPKWLAARLTGLTVDRFGTSDARRLLEQLGFAVQRA